MGAKRLSGIDADRGKACRRDPSPQEAGPDRPARGAICPQGHTRDERPYESGGVRGEFCCAHLAFNSPIRQRAARINAPSCLTPPITCTPIGHEFPPSWSGRFSAGNPAVVQTEQQTGSPVNGPNPGASRDADGDMIAPQLSNWRVKSGATEVI